jgi:dihydrofolate reductase
MARLIYVMNTSLDGYISDREGKFDWSEPSAEMYSMFNNLLRPVGTYLYGRRLYETMAVWETAHVEPGAPAFTPGLGELEREFATLWRAADKVVFSTTLSSVATPRTRIERAVDPDHIRELKAKSERDITVGGPRLAATMLAASLVDDLHVVIHPIIVGGGNPWLPQDVRTKLELVGERRLGGVVHLHYRTKTTTDEIALVR